MNQELYTVLTWPARERNKSFKDYIEKGADTTSDVDAHLFDRYGVSVSREAGEFIDLLNDIGYETTSSVLEMCDDAQEAIKLLESSGRSVHVLSPVAISTYGTVRKHRAYEKTLMELLVSDEDVYVMCDEEHMTRAEILAHGDVELVHVDKSGDKEKLCNEYGFTPIEEFTVTESTARGIGLDTFEINQYVPSRSERTVLAIEGWGTRNGLTKRRLLVFAFASALVSIVCPVVGAPLIAQLLFASPGIAIPTLSFLRDFFFGRGY